MLRRFQVGLAAATAAHRAAFAAGTVRPAVATALSPSILRLFSSTSLAAQYEADYERAARPPRGGYARDPAFDRRDRGDRSSEHRGDRSSHPRSFHGNNDRPFRPRYSDRGNDRFGDRGGSRSGGDRQDRPARDAEQKPIGEYTTFKSTMAHTEAPELKWADVPALQRPLRDAMTRGFGYEMCTPVQAAILSRMPLSPDQDFLVQAKTGTGKTLAFLVPTVNAALDKVHPLGKSTKILIISPTRELALQIANEARKLTARAKLGVQCLVGGESKSMQMRALHRGRGDIVVGTPGRLKDLLQNDHMLQRYMKTADALILDEADRMLEIGFKEDIERIMEYLPTERQTLLFSATYPSNVKKLVESALRPGYEVINTISPDDVGTVHAIRQSYAIAPLEKQPITLHSILHRGAMAEEPLKAIVFLPTTRMTMLYGELFKRLAMGPLGGVGQFDARDLYEIHSRKSQDQRIKISDRFRRAKQGILFTSDVSARGVDYPGVNLVIQVGVPSSRDQYVHRIGRTGRAGKDGQAILLLAPFEKAFLDDLIELPLVKAEDTNGCLDVGPGQTVEWNGAKSAEAVRAAVPLLDPETVENMYTANLGFYQGQVDLFKKGQTTPYAVLKDLNAFVESLGLDRFPPIPSALRGTFKDPTSHAMSRRSGGGDRRGGGGFDRRGGGDRDRFSLYGRSGNHPHGGNDRFGGNRGGSRDRDGFRGGRRSYNDDE
ncbi:hypothetical protein GGF32_001152 [Allomyces javanicus]|nr:hypothetical protein GGF32_001152 [Allomyces javanicus]